MADAVAERPGQEPADESLAELRSLIVGPEQRELLALQSHLFDRAVQTRDVSSVLPDAIALRRSDPQMAQALAPTIEHAVTASVRRDPRPLADALFPVMGPAIRKAITYTLASMMESLNRTIEHSVSWRALRWRWTAFRTGKPFAEIVLLNTLQYRVEQVFLIHAETGLLLQHASSNRAAVEDADQISAMLTAIRDFARDSFRTPDADSVDALRVGDLSVIVEQGPGAFLAGVVRGAPPMTLRAIFQEALENIHRQLGSELQSFHGDATPFERARPLLETCLVTQFRERPRSVRWRWWGIAGAVVIVLLGVWTFLTVRERQRWAGYLEHLRREPGIVVLSTGRENGKLFVGGLRDPLAKDPSASLGLFQLSPAAVESHWEAFDSFYPEFVATRARNLLKPPPGVRLAYRDGVITATGQAPARWIVESERLAPAMSGVRDFVYQGRSPEQQIKDRLEAISVLFPKGLSRLPAGQSDALGSVRALLSELNDVLRARGLRTHVEVVGHTDSDGRDIENGPLSQARADRVLGMLQPELFDRIDFTARGVGSSEPLTTGVTEPEKQRNRRTSFVVVADARPGDRLRP